MPLQQMLYREAFRMLCDRFEAEDAVQNLYMRLWERKDSLACLDAPDAYCRKMLRNICIDRWRVIRQHEESDVAMNEAIEGNAPPDAERDEAREFLEYFLASLPEQQRRVMLMQMQGYGFDEIASVTGFSAVNVRVMISRIRKKFRESYYK
jgi:RNA polymerase sigma-70 factor (ECF subfamily)